MKKLQLASTIALLFVTSLCFATNLESLNKAQVTKQVQGNTITTVPMATLQGKLLNNNPVTVFFDKNGSVRGQFAEKPADSDQTDTGTWKVSADGTLCATWQHWDNSKPICVQVYNLNNALVFVNAKNKKFETMIMMENIKSGNKMN